jgi:CubicO group peptidase (beta-lactamase class C family)
MLSFQKNINDVIDVFERNFIECGELGASVSIWKNGEKILSLGKGFREREKSSEWSSDTLIPVYSATKGPASAAMLLALDRSGLNAETPVREVWKNFPIAEATFGDMLSHQCGLAALDEKIDIWNYDEIIAAIERQSLNWLWGNGHGYHPRTFGFLLDEIVRKLTGIKLGDWWWQELARPMNWEFWIGLPEKQWSRVAMLVPARAEKGELEKGFYKEYMTEGTLTRRAFLSPKGLHAVQEMNQSRVWSAGFPSMGGVTTASALAQFYQAAIGAISSPLTESVKQALGQLRVQGDDQVLLQKLAFTAGCQMDPVNEIGQKISTMYGSSLSAFGHPGAGGSHGFGDPKSGISFAYTMNKMALNVMPNTKCLDMIDCL